MKRLTIKAKHLVLENYLWITILGFLLGVYAITVLAPEIKWEIKLTILGGPITFAFLVQKQKLDEVKLFNELFEKFNARYNRRNESLNRILRNVGKPLENKEKDTLYDYFNLCGEEYLYYQLGCIPEAAWRSWTHGMRIFCDDERIEALWKEELGTGSYYGFSLADLPPRKTPSNTASIVAVQQAKAA